IRALAESRRPERGTALFHASFWNVYLDGKVCHGTMRVPQDFSMESLPGWEKAFFGSNFSHTMRDEVCLHPAGSTGLWKQLGSAFASGLPYLHQAMRALGLQGLQVTLLDGDLISETNCVRQPFNRGEVGL